LEVSFLLTTQEIKTMGNSNKRIFKYFIFQIV
jgi:hypothetical protein